MSRCFLPALLLVYTVAFGQPGKYDRMLDHAKDLVQNSRLPEADATLQKMLKEDPGRGEAWDLLAEIRYSEFLALQQSSRGAAPGASPFLERQLDLPDNPVSAKAYARCLLTMRLALIHANDAFDCSTFIRNLEVDPPPDTAISEDALQVFDSAEEAYEKENYEAAARLYRQTLVLQPGYYNAKLYLGDALIFTGNTNAARETFRDAIATCSQCIEPRIFMVDTYMKDEMFEEALNEAISAMEVYPDAKLGEKLRDAAYSAFLKLDIRWTSREVLPNRLDTTAESDGMDKAVPRPAGAWIFYAAAKNKIASACNSQGIIQYPSSLTKSKYLEVYSWEEMLSHSDASFLSEARRMQEAGYLDCYVLVTCYHIDFYEQYRDFVSHNKSKVEAYFRKFLVPDDGQ